ITRADGTILAKSFPKFFNYGEREIEIPLEPFKVTEKQDGSLGVSYLIDNTPYIATRGSFTSDQAIKATQILREKYASFQFNPAYTYLFEIIYRENRVVVDYGNMEDLVLLAVINTETGEEYDIHDSSWVDSWPFPVVKHYDGIKDIAQLREMERENAEGFVIRFASGLRLKIKHAEYLRLHSILTHVNARVIWELLRNKQPFDDLLQEVPDEFYAWVTATRENLLQQFAAIEAQCQAIVAPVRGISTRKEQAAIVGKERYSGIIFRMLDEKDYADSIWKLLRPEAERPFRDDEA
ncbi:MAG TPA: T4 RnlA family RNA ligase, partial [Ktedonosporobacter sp.]|nr:T4 RnlA family RNA ligase [Ktedonosporobacter sp.]